MALNPRIVIADNVLVVQARQQCDLAFDPPELLTSWIDLDALHCIITAIKFVLDLRRKDDQRSKTSM